jgi:Flp pilus assembly protein TadB
MAKRATRADFAKVRAVIQREMAAGLTIDQAMAKAAMEEPDAHRPIVESPDA